MPIDEAAIFAMKLGGLTLFWALTHTLVARAAPLQMIPSFLHARAYKTRTVAPYVTVASLVVLAGGAVAKVCAAQ